MYTKRIPLFTHYYKNWYPQGKKQIPSDFSLTPLTVAVWIADDGTIQINEKTMNGARLSFATNSFPIDDVVILYEQLSEKYGDGISVVKVSNTEQHIINVNRIETCKTIFRDIDAVFPPLSRKPRIWRQERFNLFG